MFNLILIAALVCVSQATFVTSPTPLPVGVNYAVRSCGGTSFHFVFFEVIMLPLTPTENANQSLILLTILRSVACLSAMYMYV